MKRFICLLMTILLSISICACGGNPGMVDGKIVISEEEFESYCEYVELTTDNWQDYIEIVEREVIYRDAFGEETGCETKTYLTLKEYVSVSRDNAIRLTYTREDENGNRVVIGDFQFSGSVSRDIPFYADMSQDIVCEKIKGTARKVTAPEEKWNIDETGKKFLYIKCDGYYSTYGADVIDFKVE